MWARGPLQIPIDSAGLKVFGAGQWSSEKHMHSRRKCCKLHLGVDPGSGQIVAVTLTEQDLSGESQVGPLLAQIQSPIDQLTADGAYDGEPTYRTMAAHDDAIAGGREWPSMEPRAGADFLRSKSPYPIDL